MAKLLGLALGDLDPDVLALRSGYIDHRDQLADQWPTEGHTARWAAERALWISGESMICSTDEMFTAAVRAGLDAGPFTHAHDRDGSRRWQVPGAEGGPIMEVAVTDAGVVVIGPPDNPRSIPQTRTEIARQGGNTRWQNSHG